MKTVDISKLNDNELKQLITEAEERLKKSDLYQLPEKQLIALKKAYRTIDDYDNTVFSADIKLDASVSLNIYMEKDTGEIYFDVDEINYDDDEVIELAQKTKQVRDIEKKLNDNWKNFNTLLVSAGKTLGIPTDEIINLLEKDV